MSESGPHPQPPEPATEHQNPQQRGVRSFVVRMGRMGPGQQRALRELAPLYVLPYQTNALKWSDHFGREAPLVLEVGFGMGGPTAEIASNRPDTDFIGVEVHPPGVGALLQRIESAGLRNIRIVQDDAVQVLQNMVEPGSLAGIHIYFPDPWHKKRHHKRRLIQTPVVTLLASRLASGGYLHCATDWQPYADQMLEKLSAEPNLADTCSGFAPRPAWRPLTKFEDRGLKLGHGVWDLLFVRR